MREPIQVTIQGQDYVITPHPGTEGLGISLRLTGMSAGILAGVLSGTGPSLAELQQDRQEAMVPMLIESIGTMLQHPDAPKMVRDMMRHTTRNGRPLSDDAAFDVAFACNYGELTEALVQVVRGNGFLPDLGTLRGVIGV